MGTIKSYTDLQQSKTLAEILPLESADMYWSRCTITNFGDGVLKVSYAVEPCNISQFRNTKEDVPCWSLAALLSVLPDRTCVYKKTYKDGRVKYQGVAGRIKELILKDNPVDACYELILKLYELKML